MTIKYDNFMKELQALCEKHDVWFGVCYDDYFIVDIKDANKNLSLDDIFSDETKD
jgi:hypothetical protein